MDPHQVAELITRGQREGAHLDYKRDLPGNSDSDRKEFLGDVSSFANAAGGILIFGVEEKLDEAGKGTGEPGRIIGFPTLNTDAETLRIEAMVLAGISPRIPGVRTFEAQGPSGERLLAVVIPRSWAGPHMVTFKGSSRFYSRTSAGKYQLDVDEIRAAFLGSEAITDRVRNFRLERVGRLTAGEAPFPLPPGALVCLHMLPLGALSPGAQIDLRAKGIDDIDLKPMRMSGWDHRYNFDGFATFCIGDQQKVLSYVQLLRMGAIEAVNWSMLNYSSASIAGRLVEQEVILGVHRYWKPLSAAGAELPVVVMISLVGVAGHSVDPGDLQMMASVQVIDRQNVLAEPIVLNEIDSPEQVAIALKPAMDTIWQAAGRPGSPYYNADGWRRW